MLEHVADSEDCWCSPEVLQRCMECYEEESPPADCWQCQGRGLVPEYDEDQPSVIVHREN